MIGTSLHTTLPELVVLLPLLGVTQNISKPHMQPQCTWTLPLRLAFLSSSCQGGASELAFDRPCWSHFQWHWGPWQRRSGLHHSEVVAALCCWCSPISSKPSERWNETLCCLSSYDWSKLLQLEPLIQSAWCLEMLLTFAGVDNADNVGIAMP